MSAETFSFELVSPEEKLMSQQAWQVVIPGTEGHMGVRAGHSSVVSSILPGVVKILPEAEGQETQIFITGGFADITATNVTVLAEQAVNVNDLDQGAIEQEIKDLNDEKSLAESDQEKNKIEKNLLIAQAKLAAVTKGH